MILRNLRNLWIVFQGFVRGQFQPPAPLGRVVANARHRWLAIAPQRRHPLTLAVPLALLALWAGLHAWQLTRYVYVQAFQLANKECVGPFADSAAPWVILALRVFSILAAAFFLAAAVLAWTRRKPAILKILNAACITAYAWLALRFLAEAMLLSFRVEGELLGLAWWGGFFRKFWCLLPVVAGVLVFVHLRKMLRRKDVAAVYQACIVPKQLSDGQVVRSLKGAFHIHVWILFLLPWLFINPPGVTDYLVPGGGGGGGAQQVQTVKIKPKKEKKKRRMIVRTNSAISFYQPSMEDSTVKDQVLEITQNTYKAGGGEGGGKGFGKGPGSGGGWANGDSRGYVRFIRLQHGGPHWDDGMDEKTGRADMNFLEALRAISGFKIAPASEAHAIGLLKSYRPGMAPPFVFITGRGPISGISSMDCKVLHDYCLNEGGLLFADDSGAGFHMSFVQLMRQTFPELALVDIPNDDPLFQMPYVFPNGAPPIWHVGGDRALGIKYNGRWAVIYFPGNIHDAWKTGHTGLADHIAQQAFKMGFNIIYYAFTQYTELHPHAQK